jgi:type III restriction enzyme
MVITRKQSVNITLTQLYRLDWGIVFKGQKKLYFVAETKSHTDYGDLWSSEWQKIQCGYRQFEEFPEVGFKHITDLRDLETK